MKPSKPCAYCQRPFIPHDPQRRYCSRQCAADARGSAFYAEMGRKGGRHRAEKLRPGQIEKLKALAAGLEPWEAFKAGAQWQCKRTNSTSYARGHRSGYAKGWDDCAAAMGRRIKRTVAA